MGKLIRKTYPAGFSIGLLALIFIISFLLSHQIFEVSIHDLDENEYVYFGMFLVAMAVIIMVLIIWEEILFPIKTKEVNGGILFKNHRTKLYLQLLIFCSIPVIFVFIYLEFEVNHIRFFIWAAICMLVPILEKLASGINNHNDFLNLTNEQIEYKNNEKEGIIQVRDIQHISIISDERHVIRIQLSSNEEITIDVDEMELDAYYDSINKYIKSHYKHLLKESPAILTK